MTGLGKLKDQRNRGSGGSGELGIGKAGGNNNDGCFEVFTTNVIQSGAKYLVGVVVSVEVVSERELDWLDSSL